MGTSASYVEVRMKKIGDVLGGLGVFLTCLLIGFILSLPFWY